MSSDAVSYLPGQWVAVSGPGMWLLVDLPPQHEIVQRSWAALSVDPDPDALVDGVLDAMVSAGVASVPPFALVRVRDDVLRAVVRGTARAEIGAESGSRTVVAAPGVLWADELVEGTVDTVLLAGPSEPTSAVELPMASGVTMAASIRIEPGSKQSAAVHPLAPPEPSPAVAERAGQPDADETGQPDADESSADASPSYDFLFGATQRPPTDLVGAAPEVDPDADTVPEPPTPSVTQDPPTASETAQWHTSAAAQVAAPPAESVPPQPPTGSGGVIDALPWASPAPPAPPPPEDTGVTVDRSALRAATAEAPPVAGPTVLAGHCPAGHLSPPHAATCRICNAPMPQQDAFEIARPTLGVLRLSTGDVVNLDRGVLFGRAPAEPAEVDGERPNLVKLASPDNDISRNHAEVVLDGWHVFVRDLGSTNGTVVVLPGRAPNRLRADDLQLLEHGTVVTLADEVSFTFEVTG